MLSGCCLLRAQRPNQPLRFLDRRQSQAMRCQQFAADRQQQRMQSLFEHLLGTGVPVQQHAALTRCQLQKYAARSAERFRNLEVIGLIAAFAHARQSKFSFAHNQQPVQPQSGHVRRLLLWERSRSEKSCTALLSTELDSQTKAQGKYCTMIIALEGIDGSGKGTQAKLLVESLKSEFAQVKALSFPRYGVSRGAALVGEYLNGRLSVGIEDIWGPAMFFAMDRFEALGDLKSFSGAYGACLIVDRFVASNIAHQSCKEQDDRLRGRFQDEIFRIEHNILGIPEPDLTLFFDIDVTLAQTRILQKEKRDYTIEKLDLHERDRTYLERSAASYREVFSRGLYQNVLTFSAGDRNSDSIAADVSSSVLAFFAGSPR